MEGIKELNLQVLEIAKYVFSKKAPEQEFNRASIERSFKKHLTKNSIEVGQSVNPGIIGEITDTVIAFSKESGIITEAGEVYRMVNPYEAKKLYTDIIKSKKESLTEKVSGLSWKERRSMYNVRTNTRN